MSTATVAELPDNLQRLKEGSAEFFLPKDVFYNPVQEFNRDMR
jgi:tRNA G26 N,N-dimethylase Trm1